jgi:hypothetical protein
MADSARKPLRGAGHGGVEDVRTSQPRIATGSKLADNIKLRRLLHAAIQESVESKDRSFDYDSESDFEDDTTETQQKGVGLVSRIPRTRPEIAGLKSTNNMKLRDLLAMAIKESNESQDRSFDYDSESDFEEGTEAKPVQ